MTTFYHIAVAFALLVAVILVFVGVGALFQRFAPEDKPDAKGEDPRGDAGE